MIISSHVPDGESDPASVDCGRARLPDPLPWPAEAQGFLVTPGFIAASSSRTDPVQNSGKSYKL